MNKNPVLELCDLTKCYKTAGTKQLKIFENLDLNLSESELVGIIAPSGTGKTSLLSISGLLDQPSSGSVFILGEDSKRMAVEKRNSIRRNHIGFVFQSSNLLNEFSALENVALSKIIKGFNFNDSLKHAENLLSNIGLGNHLNSRPLELSGGEQQRVAICRAIANDPQLVLADEPTGNLDHENSKLVFDLLMDMVKQKKVSALIATHNMDLIKKMDRVLKLTKTGLVEL
jgi:lipoprotein-releasing system ATP-binding protein